MEFNVSNLITKDKKTIEDEKKEVVGDHHFLNLRKKIKESWSTSPKPK